MATNGGFEATNDLEASKSPNENDQPTDNTANQTRRFLEVDYRNTKHSAICSIIVFLALILILGAVMFVLIFLLDGQEAGPDRELQTELKGTFILSVTITIVNLDYQSSLSDPTSKDYIDLENRFSKKIASVLSQTDLMDKYRGVEITNVRSGSVILDFLLLFCEPLMTQDDVIQTVQEALTSSGSPNTVVGDELIISQNNLVIEAAPQQTSLQNISCSDPRPTSTPVMTSSPSTVMSSSTSQPLSPTPTSSPTSTPAVSSSISTLTPASSSVTSSQTTSMTPSVEMTMMTSSIITSQAAVPTTTSTAPSLSSTMAAKTTTMTSTSMSSSAQPTTTQMQTAPPTRSTTAALQPSTTISSKRTVLMSSTVTPEQTTQMMTTSIGGMETSPSVTQPTVTTTTESLPGCDISQGQILSAGDVKVITSPGYPRGYLNNLNCHWSITGIASENMVILLEFVFFDVGDDYLEVDIPTEGQINQRFSGSSTPPSIRSQDRNIQLRFVSDGAVTSIGFEVRLRLVSVLETTPPAITTEDMGVLETSPSVTQPTVIATTESLPNCDISQGQILSAGDVKVISSPGYPRGYLNNLNCQWSVTGIASENMVILLEFVFFDVGDDYLEVNIPTEGQINQRFSGSSTPPSIRSQDRNIQLRFVSDGAVTSIGFEVRLRLVSVLETTPPAITTEALGGMDTSPSVTKPTVIATTGSLPGCDISQGQILSAGDVKIISSPGYPRGYLNNLNCEWSVTGIASENMVILLEFVFFDVGDDYLEVNIPTEGQINQRFSGSSTPPSIRSQDQNIQLRFVSDGAITSIGFQVTVRLVSVLETTPPTLTTEAMACSDDLSFVTQEQNQTLTSPGYPNAYSSNMNCQWMLQSTIPNSQIILTFLTFDIGDDLLRIEHNGRTVELTGADLPMPIITDSANVNLVFTSNNVNNQNPGFEILAHIYIPPVSTQAQLTEITTTAPPQIPIAPPDNSCIPGSILISVESGPKTFSSPGYPDYNYASNTECSWNFILIGSSIENKALQLRFVNFDVGDDSVVVEGSSPAIRRFQGSALPPLIISSGNKFVIKLTTDSQDNHPGFNATVSVVDK
ncbi:tolloid-like protein 2 isoform X4 [Apostichopus japonicus]|uniref:tolloid-like protein 2 isoform X4 n=1 Tax=Stichopus japonicus TaxID=307972 RepID=UPI003AB1B4E4